MTGKVKLRGSPRDIGLQHGRELAEPIAACIEVYRAVFGRSEEAVEAAAKHFETVTRNFAPKLAEEIDGIAEGSGQPIYWIYALNARSELVSMAAPECTAVYLAKAGVLGQTWDWIDRLEDLFVVLEIEHEDGHRLFDPDRTGALSAKSVCRMPVSVSVSIFCRHQANMAVCLSIFSYAR